MRSGLLACSCPMWKKLYPRRAGGQVIAHPDQSRLGKRVMDTEADMMGERLGEMVNAIKNGTNFSAALHSPDMNANIIFVTRPLTIGNSSTPWTAASIIPESVVMAPVYRMTMISIILGVGDFTHNLEKIRALIKIIKAEATELSGIGTELATNMKKSRGSQWTESVLNCH